MPGIPPIFGDGGGAARPEIDYPTRWSYHVIGADPDALRNAVLEAVGGAEHDWEGGAESRRGRWHSVRIRVLVDDEPHRLAILARLQDSDAVRLVL